MERAVVGAMNKKGRVTGKWDKLSRTSSDCRIRCT